MVSQFGSLGYTIMVKTADLTVVQKTIIDTLHKEGKLQTFKNSRIWVTFTRNGLRLGSRHQELPHTDVSKNLATVVVRGILPRAKEKKNWTAAQWSKVLFSNESKFCI